MNYFKVTIFALIGYFHTSFAEPAAPTGSNSVCPEYLDHSYRKLHSQDTLNLCSIYKKQAILIVNTASHCGFTKQFTALEALHQKHKNSGLTVIGFSSDDFNQEAKSEAESASICFKNHGVSFLMLAPTHVRGKSANPSFKGLSEQSKAPSWNFNKYLITENGSKVEHFSSRTKPLGSKLEAAIINALEG